ncbi:TPA: hypothetical protein ENX78_03575 [Candidatus Poribacteria bacterium]|nr:hypothetical protein [Candidatus Poribacteria bacterium]
MIKSNLSFRFGIFIFVFLSLFLIYIGISECSEYKSFINSSNNWYEFQGGFEIGFLDVLSHNIQFGSDGTKFDYVDEGGQDILFPFTRLTAEMNIHDRHKLIFLIQPLDIRTEALLRRDIVVDELTFPKDTPLELRYLFNFYRLSYLYDFSRAKDKEIAIGLSLQIRNASISFKSTDGKLFRINSGVGPVPIFKFRVKYPFNNGLWLGTEIDGFYASGKYITGSTNDFEGAILDASVRLGFKLTEYLEAYLNMRYIGGGAKGTEKNSPGPGDGFTDNWLKTSEVSLGFYVK